MKNVPQATASHEPSAIPCSPGHRFRPAMLATIAAFILTLTSVTFGATEATLYVSPVGSGTSFSAAQPGSLAGAQAQVRTMTSSMTGDIVVYLYGGTYSLTSSFVLQENSTTHDSGTGGHNVIYEAYPGQIPIISGGQTVTGWSLYNSTLNIYRANVGTGVNSRQLYVNGVRAVRARGQLNPGGFTVTSSGFTTTNSAMASWGNPSNIELVQRDGWKQFRCPVSSISGNTITMQTPCWTYASVVPGSGHYPWGGGEGGMSDVSWVENAYELLVSPGMWYLNESTGYLYYIPRPNENLSTATVVLPVVQKLVDGSGASLTSPVHNIIISGITFAYGTWLGPSTGAGYADNQAGIQWAGVATPLKTMGNVSFQTANNIQLLNNTFMHLGGSAIDFGNGAQFNQVVGNRIVDISSAGVTIGECNDASTTNSAQMTNGNTVSNNYITNIGVEFEDAVGIWFGYAENTTIANNAIENTPYSGISVGWGWGMNSYAQNNQILNNFVGDVMETLQDGGSIYTLSAQTGSLVNNNYMRNSCDQGIYWDEGTAYYTGTNNVADNPADNWMQIWTSSIHDDTATGNFTNNANYLNNGTNCTVSDTTVVSGENWPLAAQAVIANSGLQAGYAGLQNAQTEINDTDPACVYTGSSWTYSPSRGLGEYDDDLHYSTNNGDYVTYTFYGSGISVVSELDAAYGNVDIYLDGIFQETYNCASSSARVPETTIYSTSNLTPANHTIKVVKDNGTYMVVDAFVVTSPREALINDTVPVYDHVPSDWSYSNSRGVGDLDNDVHYTETNGEYVQYTFTGTGITPLVETDYASGDVDVYLDGAFQTTIHCLGSSCLAQQRLYSASGLPYGSHSIKLVKDNGSFMVLDGFALPIGGASAATNGLTSGNRSDAITTDGASYSGGGFDGNGYSLSATVLGSALSWNGLEFNFLPPNTSNGASNETVTLPAGQFSTLSILADAVNGNQTSQTFTVNYTNGTHSTFTQSMSDWGQTPAGYSGEATAATMSYRDKSNGTTQSGTFYLHGYTFGINPALTVSSIVLPANANVVVVAIDLSSGGGTNGLTASECNITDTTVTDGTTFSGGGGIDGGGDAYSATQLGSTFTWNGLSFTLPAANGANGAANETITLPSGKFATVSLLATGVNGNQTAQTFKVNYTNGTNTTFTQSLSDWSGPQGYSGESTALEMTRSNHSDGSFHSGPAYLYGYAFPLNNTLTVQSIVLPANSNVVVVGIDLH